MAYRTEYDRQPLGIKVTRWLRHRPIMFAWWMLFSVYWLAIGAPIYDLFTSRWQSWLFIGRMCRAQAECRMGKVIPLKEVLREMGAA